MAVAKPYRFRPSSVPCPNFEYSDFWNIFAPIFQECAFLSQRTGSWGTILIHIFKIQNFLIMSKGNLLFGQGRGKIGDLVLTRVAGEQVARSRNRNPKNPRTTKQMVQRAAMATLVEFFKRGNRNLFKFAFESKKPGESDYNAFVRANINRVPVQSKKTLRENGFVGGEYIMTEGSLPQPSFRFDVDAGSGILNAYNLDADAESMTVGDLSKEIIAQNGLQDGDIITIVGISGKWAKTELDIVDAKDSGVLVSGDGSSIWNILQFTLDVNSEELVSSLGIFNMEGYTPGSGEIPFRYQLLNDVDYTADAPCMLTVIASRVTPGGVLVSTSTLACNGHLKQNNIFGSSDEWKIWVAKHFMETTAIDAPAEDILKGSLSAN